MLLFTLLFVYFIMPGVILNSFLKHCLDEGLEIKYEVVLLDVMNDYCFTLKLSVKLK